MGKLIKNKIRDYQWDRLDDNSGFEKMFKKALDKFSKDNPKINKKAIKRKFVRFMMSFYHIDSLSIKDCKRLINPQKGIHTKYSFKIVYSLLKYVSNSGLQHTVEDVLKTIKSTDNNITSMYNILISSENSENCLIKEYIQIQKERIIFYVDSRKVPS